MHNKKDKHFLLDVYLTRARTEILPLLHILYNSHSLAICSIPLVYQLFPFSMPSGMNYEIEAI